VHPVAAATSALGALPHLPLTHATVGSHLVPQAPQLLGSAIESMHVGTVPPPRAGPSQTLSLPGAQAQPPSCRMVKLLKGHLIPLELAPLAPALESAVVLASLIGLPAPALPPVLANGMYPGFESELHDAAHAASEIVTRERVVFMSDPKREPTRIDAHGPVQIARRGCTVLASQRALRI
jgi:hypothetical protein